MGVAGGTVDDRGVAFDTHQFDLFGTRLISPDGGDPVDRFLFRLEGAALVRGDRYPAGAVIVVIVWWIVSHVPPEIR
jgi:hypothetical protein